ncbi:hypothetical protein E0L17_05055 [Olsenella sp. SW781]|uniref:hypothetical protein n=1 Tax=Olsenella sp. SW781 TaxID=2530046 RepID=UPI00143CA69A|nr:hypothetical protein [Olsenella sp. SW781]NJE80694.1 hypothetical protein [Olsenella sp. SW781]
MVRTSREIDPFDVEWSETDPLDREVTMLKSIVELRERQGKHPDPPEFISTSEVRTVVSDPDRIDESATHEFREVYYRNESEEDYPYSRAVVDFRDNPQRGIVVSWSRYEAPVSSYGVKWRRG